MKNTMNFLGVIKAQITREKKLKAAQLAMAKLPQVV